MQDIAVALVDGNGQLLTTYPMTTGRDATNDLTFQATIDAKNQGYKAALLELSDPAHNAKARIELEGEVPELMHWDGQFPGRLGIEKGRRYFMRLVLFYADGRALSSPWAFFSTRLRTAYDTARKVKGSYISLYVIPTGAMHYVSLWTQNRQATLYPNVFGDVALVWKNTHSIILKLEATSNILFGNSNDPTNFAYSDVSLAYRFRLAGAPIRAPLLPPEPPSGNYKYRIPPSRTEIYGKPFNAEAGVRLFYSTIRGEGNQLIDRETARRFSGVVATLEANQAFDAFRAHLTLEAGYSVFVGKLSVYGIGGAVTYERLENVAPGLEVRYYSITGRPSVDSFTGIPGLTSISNRLLLAGLTLKFKL